MTGASESRPRPAPRAAPPGVYIRHFRPVDPWIPRFEAMGREARERGLNPDVPEEFARLAEVRAALRMLAEGEGDAEEQGRLGMLLYHAWHFARAGEPVQAVTVELLDELVATGPPASWTLSSSQRAGYVAFPRRAVTAPGPAGGSDRWLEGFFWMRSKAEFVALVILAGGAEDFTLLPLPPLPLTMTGLWAREPVRARGHDFAPSRPDRGRYGVEVAAEIVKLALRALWRVAGPSR